MATRKHSDGCDDDSRGNQEQDRQVSDEDRRSVSPVVVGKDAINEPNPAARVRKILVTRKISATVRKNSGGPPQTPPSAVKSRADGAVSAGATAGSDDLHPSGPAENWFGGLCVLFMVTSHAPGGPGRAGCRVPVGFSAQQAGP